MIFNRCSKVTNIWLICRCCKVSVMTEFWALCELGLLCYSLITCWVLLLMFFLQTKWPTSSVEHVFVKCTYVCVQCLCCDTAFSIIVNDDQQDATILAYLFIPNQLYVFQAMSSPIIRSTWLYLQLPILSTDTAADCIMDEMELHLIHDTSRQQYRWTISGAVNTVKRSWWWAKTSPETCRAD